jgi:hypothetical protein
VPEWEFHTLIGVEPAVADRLADEVWAVLGESN